MEIPDTLANQFLIALPALADSPFARTVTLICQHDAEGAMGVVVNRPAEYTLGEVFEQMGITSEDDARTYSAKLDGREHLSAKVFVERGGTSVVTDDTGNVYIASGQVYIYNKSGKQIGVLEVPERPSSLAFGGKDRRTLFIGARGSLYAIRVGHSFS